MFPQVKSTFVCNTLVAYKFEAFILFLILNILIL